jgi:hypothetical protein
MLMALLEACSKVPSLSLQKMAPLGSCCSRQKSSALNNFSHTKLKQSAKPKKHPKTQQKEVVTPNNQQLQIRTLIIAIKRSGEAAKITNKKQYYKQAG